MNNIRWYHAPCFREDDADFQRFIELVGGTRNTAECAINKVYKWVDLNANPAKKPHQNTEKTAEEIDKIAGRKGLASAALAVGYFELYAGDKIRIVLCGNDLGALADKRERDRLRMEEKREEEKSRGDSRGECSYIESRVKNREYDLYGAGESVKSPPYEAEPPQTATDTPSLTEIIEVMRGAGLPEGEAEKCARKFCEVNGNRWHALTAWARAARGYAERWRANLTVPDAGEVSTETRTPSDDDAFRAWYTPLMQAHPALRECASLPPNVEKAARAAYASLPNAAAHAPMLTAYFADRLQEDKHGKKFWRPDGGEQYFSNLADIIAHAYRWQKETGAGKKKRRDCNDPSRYRSSRMGCNDPNDYASPAEMGEVCSEEEKRAFFADMRRDLGMTAEPPPTPPPGYDDGVPF